MYALLPSFFAFFVLRRFKALFFLLCTFVPLVPQKSFKTQKKAEKRLFCVVFTFVCFIVVLLLFFRLSVCMFIICYICVPIFCTFCLFCAILRYIYNV